MNAHVVAGSGPKTPATAGLSKEFDDFVYLISHDVRNSVRALIEVPQWIAEDLDRAGYRMEGSLAENFKLLNTHASRLDRMLYDLLIHSRIGRMQEVRQIDLAEAVETVIEDLPVPAAIRVAIHLKAPTIRLGERDILTLLMALFSNALRHRDDRTSLISLVSRTEAGRTILRFADDGPGVAPQYRERIFQAMTTLKSRDEVEGSGMGLAHVAKILQVYGGALTWIDRPDGRGLAFDLAFPA